LKQKNEKIEMIGNIHHNDNEYIYTIETSYFYFSTFGKTKSQ